MKKNILSILAAVLLTVTLAGCSGGPAVTDPAETEISVRLFPTGGWVFMAQITLKSMKKAMILM